MRALIAAAVVGVLCWVGSADAVTLQTFGPSAHNADTAIMDATLGITGMSIESFADPVLIPRLSVQFTTPNGGPFTTLPGSFSFDPIEAWDGDPVLINRPNQDNAAPYASTTFLIAGGTVRFGIGLGDFQTHLGEAELLINGVSFGNVSDLPNYVNGPGPGETQRTRNLYIVATAGANELITEVTFNNPAHVDAHLFDHVAIDPAPASVPEPASMSLLGLGLTAAILARRKRG